MTENRSRPRPVDFAWNDPEPVQQEPTGPALGNYPADMSDLQRRYNDMAGVQLDRLAQMKIRPYSGPFTVDRRVAWNERLARFLDKLADRAREWR